MYLRCYRHKSSNSNYAEEEINIGSEIRGMPAIEARVHVANRVSRQRHQFGRLEIGTLCRLHLSTLF